MRQPIVNTNWEYEVTKNEGEGLKGYGYNLVVYKEGEPVYNGGGFYDESMAKSYAIQVFLDDEFGIEPPDLESDASGHNGMKKTAVILDTNVVLVGDNWDLDSFNVSFGENFNEQEWKSFLAFHNDIFEGYAGYMADEVKDIIHKAIDEWKQIEKEKQDSEMGEWEERWHKRSSMLVCAEDYQPKLQKLQRWVESRPGVPKRYKGHNAFYDLDENGILEIGHHSTAIVTVDAKNKKILNVTTGGWNSPSTKRRIQNILWILYGMGYGRINMHRYEYDHTETDEQRDEAERKLQNEEREYRNKARRDKYHREKMRKKLQNQYPHEWRYFLRERYGNPTEEDLLEVREEIKQLREQYPEEIKEYEEKFDKNFTKKDIESYVEEKEIREKYPEEYDELKRNSQYVNWEAINKLREEKELENWEERWHKRTSHQLPNIDFSILKEAIK